MGKTLHRYNSVRRADDVNDQHGSASISSALGAATQEELQTFILSRLRQIIFGEHAPENWYDDLFSAGVLSLRELTKRPSGGGGEAPPVRLGAPLAGVTDGANREFHTQEPFVHGANGRTIEVWHNGRFLAQTSDQIPGGDYTVAESRGPGTGFDTVLLNFTPTGSSLLQVNYTPVAPALSTHSSQTSDTTVFRFGAPLLGDLDGVNREFHTSDKFDHGTASGRTIVVWHNGRLLQQASRSDPTLGDYTVAESGGAGTGFDTIMLLSFAPVGTSTLLANYTL